MAEDFQILVHKDERTLHLKLMGDLDENSARKVLKLIKGKRHSTSRVFVHTNSLHRIHSGARRVFQENSDSMELKSIPVLFTGEKADKLAPNGKIVNSRPDSSLIPFLSGSMDQENPLHR